MIRPIVKMPVLLSAPSVDATPLDAAVGQDLLDTLAAHAGECVGLAANMIGVNKAIIVFDSDGTPLEMFNPVILKKSGAFETEEGCLSLSGVRKTTRYQEIEVEYQDLNFIKKRQKFTGWTAQIIQHECDHLQGILI